MIAELEPELFTQAIRLAQGNQAKTARWLGVTRPKMREKLIQLGRILHGKTWTSESCPVPGAVLGLRPRRKNGSFFRTLAVGSSFVVLWFTEADHGSWMAGVMDINVVRK